MQSALLLFVLLLSLLYAVLLAAVIQPSTTHPFIDCQSARTQQVTAHHTNNPHTCLLACSSSRLHVKENIHNAMTKQLAGMCGLILS